MFYEFSCPEIIRAVTQSILLTNQSKLGGSKYVVLRHNAPMKLQQLVF